MLTVCFDKKNSTIALEIANTIYKNSSTACNNVTYKFNASGIVSGLSIFFMFISISANSKNSSELSASAFMIAGSLNSSISASSVGILLESELNNSGTKYKTSGLPRGKIEPRLGARRC